MQGMQSTPVAVLSAFCTPKKPELSNHPPDEDFHSEEPSSKQNEAVHQGGGTALPRLKLAAADSALCYLAFQPQMQPSHQRLKFSFPGALMSGVRGDVR